MRLAYFDCFSGVTGAMALGALPEDEAALFADPLETCPSCAAELIGFLETAAILGSSVAQTPPASLRRTVMKAISQTPQLPPLTDPATITVNEERARDWLSKGAVPSDRVVKILASQGIGEMVAEVADEAAIELHSGHRRTACEQAAGEDPESRPDLEDAALRSRLREREDRLEHVHVGEKVLGSAVARLHARSPERASDLERVEPRRVSGHQEAIIG